MSQTGRQAKNQAQNAAGRAENSLNKSEMYRLAQQDGYLPGPMDPS